MKLLYLFSICITCNVVFISCNDVEPLGVKTNYHTLSPEARYLGECTAMYDWSAKKVLVKIEYDSSKTILNKSVAGNGIRENIFYNKNGDITKFESFIDDVPQRVYNAKYNGHGDVIKQYEMNQRSGEIEKMNGLVRYDYDENPKNYTAIVSEDGQKILRIEQNKIGDTIIRTVKSLDSPPILSQKETEVYKNGLLVSKSTYGLNSNFRKMTMEPGYTEVTYVYNKDGKCIKEHTKYPQGSGKPESTKRITYQHGLIASQSRGSQEREKYKLYELEYTDN